MDGHCKSPKTAFTDTDLNELEWVFECVCTTIKGHGLLTENTKSFIRRRLFMLACNETICAITLLPMLLGRRSSPFSRVTTHTPHAKRGAVSEPNEARNAQRLRPRRGDANCSTRHLQERRSRGG